tara:strand:- start:291 stop:872 length:582 start_codon:yes stop_codon:yes gene_type:complete
MSVNINIVSDEEEVETPPEPQGIKIEIVQKDEIGFKLMTRSAINGDIMILDHKDIDIVLQQKDSKIITFAKETISDFTYGAEARLLEFMRSKGILEYDSIQGGNIYGSLEGKLMSSEETEVNKAALLVISEWMTTEQSYLKGTTAYDDMEDEHLLDPDNEFSTNLGEVPQEQQKGSIRQDSLFAPYLYGRFSY